MARTNLIPLLPRARVTSSHVHSIGFHAETSQLQIQFKGGGSPIFDYLNVPQNVAASFLASKSKGKFFHEKILGKYNSVPRDQP